MFQHIYDISKSAFKIIVKLVRTELSSDWFSYYSPDSSSIFPLNHEHSISLNKPLTPFFSNISLKFRCAVSNIRTLMRSYVEIWFVFFLKDCLLSSVGGCSIKYRWSKNVTAVLSIKLMATGTCWPKISIWVNTTAGKWMKEGVLKGQQ